MTINKTAHSNDTRDRLRQLMSRHTAATVSRPAPLPTVASPPVAVTSKPAVTLAPAQPNPAAPTASHSMPAKSPTAGERCTVRLLASELTKIDEMILHTHQRVGERITVSDVLRIGLARITAEAPITSGDIAALRATDGRRKHN